MRRIALLCCLGLAFASATIADEASHRDAAMRVLEASQARKTMDQVLGVMDQIMGQQMAAFDQPPDAEDSMSALRVQMRAWMETVFTWEEMSALLVDTWTSVFTEEELHQLADFYETQYRSA